MLYCLGMARDDGTETGSNDTTHRYSDEERLAFYRCLTRIFQMERQYGGDAIDAILIRAVAIGRLEQRPMDISSLAAYLGLPRQTVSRRVNKLIDRKVLEATREGNRTIIFTSERAQKVSLPFVQDAIDHTIEFVEKLKAERSK